MAKSVVKLSPLASNGTLALHGAPLCPAGHLPLKGGDRQRRPRPDLCNVGDWRNPSGRPISPLEGEMSGRTEGATGHNHFQTASDQARLQYLLICIYIIHPDGNGKIMAAGDAIIAAETPASGATPGLRRLPPISPGLGIVEQGAIAARDGRIVFAGPEADLPGSRDSRRRDHRLRRPLDHARPDRLPHPSRLRRRPRPRVRDAAGRRDLRGDRARRRRHRLVGQGTARGERGRARARSRCRGSTR